MPQTKGSPQDNTSSRRLSWPMIAAVFFLVVSLAASVVWIVMALSGPPMPQPSQTERRPTDVPQRRESDDSTEATADQPTLQPNSLVVALAPLGENAPALGDQLAQALQEASEGAVLNGAAIQTVTLPSVQTAVDDIDLTRDAPEAAMVIAWEPAEESLIRFYLLGMSTAPLPRVDSTLIPWDVPAPGAIPLTIGETDGLALPAGLVIGLLEASAGAGDQAFRRIQTLQGLPTTIPIDKMSSNQAVFFFAIGRTQAAQGDPTGALQSYSQALKLHDDFSAAAINRGNVYLALGDATAALSAFDAAAEPNGPISAAVLYDRVLAYQMMGDSNAALLAASQAVEQAPDAAWSTNLRGTIAYLQGDYASASNDFAAANQAAPGLPEPIFNQALAAYALEDIEQALGLFEQLLQIDPDNPTYRLHQGEAFHANGDAEQAKEAFGQAIKLDATYLEAYLQRARVHYETGNGARAQRDAEEAIALNPDDGRAYQIIGDVLLAEDEFDKAEDAYTEAIERNVEGIEVFSARGWARHRTRYNGGAIEDYERALELGAEDNTLLFRLGFALFDAGRYQDSLEALSGAVNGGLDTAEAHAALSIALDANLRRDEAEQQYQHALDLDRRFGDKIFLGEQPLWSQSAISRAMSITRRLED